MPRVISGLAGRIPLNTLKGMATRPTADKTKEAMFSMLQSRMTFQDKRVLELFAGSGQLGIEALSRGAGLSLFVEKSPQAVGIIKQNLLKTKLEHKAEVWTMSAQAALARLQQEKQTFDLILADPPYRDVSVFWPQIAPLLAGFLTTGGFFILEYSSQDEIESLQTGENIELVTKLKLMKHCQYGAAMVLFLQNS